MPISFDTRRGIEAVRRRTDPRNIAESIRRKFVSEDIDAFLTDVKGVIHVGANAGQERDLYARHGLNVLWIEPIPSVFERLQANLSGYEQQHCLCNLVTDKDGENYVLHISNNEGLSSSILDLDRHKEVWPEVGYVGQITLKGVTLSSLVADKGIDLTRYDSLVMDTQGSELLVLRGASSILDQFKYIKTEAADFEAYEGCARLKTIRRFLGRHGYREWRRARSAYRPWVGSYFDVVFRRRH